MRVIWIIGGGALLIALAGLFWWGGAERASRAVAPADRTPTAREAEDLAAASGPPAGEAERVGVTEQAAEPAERDAAEPEGSTDLRPVRLRLIDAESRSPLPGYRLDVIERFQRGAKPVPAITDALGAAVVELLTGEHLALHIADAADLERSVARALEPQVFEVPRVAAGALADPHDVILEASRPPRVLEVDVFYEDGRPATGAWSLFHGITDVQPFVDLRARVDERGRARIGVWDPEGFTDGLLYAWDEDGFVSEYVSIEAPFVPGVRRLVLRPGARVEVVVRDAREEPVTGRRVLLASELPLGQRVYRETDDGGKYEFVGVHPGEYAIGAWHADSSVYTMQELEVRHGERRSVQFVLEEGEQFAAVHGRAVDEEGRPLAGVNISITPDGLWASNMRTDEKGEFAFYSDDESGYLLQPNIWAEGDVFEPDSLHVEHGARDVVFTRVRKAQERSFEAEVYDIVTGEELEHFVATIDRGPGTEEWSSSYAPRRSFTLQVLDESRWRVGSHGYIVRSLALREELDALAPGERLRVGLEPGLDHATVVKDASTLAPLEGVLFSSPTAGELRSDTEGRVHFVSDHWSIYTITKEGYAPDTFDPDDYVLWDFGPVLLVDEATAAEGQD